MIDMGRIPTRFARAGAASLLLWACAGPLWGANRVDVYQFPTAEQETRFHALTEELRCPKCLNTNLAGSDAPIAEDLRRTVYRLITEENRSDAEIRGYLQERYGDFVLYDPPFRPGTWLLWIGPALFLLLGALVLVRLLRQPPAAPLSDAESERVRALLEQD